MWPFSETNAAAMRTLSLPALSAGFVTEPLRNSSAVFPTVQGQERNRRFGFESIPGFLSGILIRDSWRCPMKQDPTDEQAAREALPTEAGRNYGLLTAGVIALVVVGTTIYWVS
jgi:hypothetical protein